MRKFFLFYSYYTSCAVSISDGPVAALLALIFDNELATPTDAPPSSSFVAASPPLISNLFYLMKNINRRMDDAWPIN